LTPLAINDDALRFRRCNNSIDLKHSI